MKSFVILALVGACIHLSTSKEPDKEDKQEYSGPVVYSNLPPPVLYFPNFPEKPEVSRGDEEDKKVEYIPFPYKDLPLLVYQSDNQPPVHVVEKPSANQEDSAYSGPAVYQYSDYVQNETPVDESKEQHLSDVYPDLANQQYISIGVSTYHDDSPPQQNVAYNVQKTASQPSQAQNGGQQQAMQQQSGGQYGGNQGEMQQMAVGQYETLNAKPQQNGGQYPIQQQQPSSGQYASQSTSQQQSGDQQQQRGGQYASTPIAIPLQYGGQYQVQAAPVAQQQNGGQYASAVQQQQNDGQYANAMQQQNGGQYPGPKQQPNGGQYNNVMQQQNGGLYAGPKQQQQNGGQYIIAIQHQNSGVYASAMQQQNGGQYLTPNAMKQQNIAQYASAMQQQNQKQQSPAPVQYIPNVVPTQNQQQYIPTQNQGIIYAPAQSIQHTSPKEPQNVMMQNIAQQYGNQPKQNVAPQMMMNAYQGQQQVVNNLPQQQFQAQMVEVKKEQQAIVKQALGMPNLPIIYPPRQNNNYQFPKPSQQVPQPPRNMIPPKTMPKNTPQAMPVKEQSDSEAQALQNGPFVSIGVYPYEGKHEPQQVFTFVIPQDLQKPENDENSKPLYQDKRRPEMSEQKKPQQPTRYKDPSVEEESRYQPKDLYMMQQQQQVGKNGNNNNRAKPQEPKPQQQQYQKKQNNQPQPTKSSSDEEDPQVEYQHILIHIPHGGVSQPQISVVQGSEENQKIRYSEVPQRIPEEQVQKNYPEEREYPRVFKGTPADLDQEMPKFPIEAYRGSESKLYPKRNPFPRWRPHFNGQNFERYGQGRSPVPRHRGVGRDEYVAEPSFHVQRVLSPGILESSNITDFKFLDDPESEVYYEDAKVLHGYRGQNLVDDTAAKLFASQAVPYSHNEFHQGFSKVKTGHTAMELMRVIPVPFPMHPPVSFRPLPVVPYLPYNYQSGQRFLPRHPAFNANRPKGSQKYGGFFRKLVASFLGVRRPISNREGTRDGEPPIPTSAIIRTDHRGLDGIPIPLTPTRRMSSAPSQMPPIIVYKGKQPPIEVYGSKDDIETMKADKRSDEDEEVLDAVLSELANEDEFSEKSVEDDPLVVLESPKESNTTDSSSPLDADSWSAAFKEDVKELVSLLPKEENSDLLLP